MIAFAYYGAKNGMLSTLLPMLPKCSHYVEPFCGSAAVLLNRDPSPIETMNDLNSDIVNFFKVLRESPEPLVDALYLTPYSHSEFTQAWEYSADPIEQARRFYIRTQMDVAKAGHRKDKSWSKNKAYRPGNHSYCVKNFAAKIPGLMDVELRLKMAQIENLQAIECICKYDSPETLFYLDPPYLPATRSSKDDYRHEFSFAQHEELAMVLNSISGKAALSGYDHPQMSIWYKNFHCYKFETKQVPMARGSGLRRQECLWTNYNPFKITGQLELKLIVK